MAAGLGVLGLSPAEFWNATPKEIAAGLRGRLGRGEVLSPPGRGDLARLIDRYPDEERHHG